MNARITTYGGPINRTVKHWQLHVDDRFIADTSNPVMAELYQKIADELNHPAKYVFDANVPPGQTYGLASANTQAWRAVRDGPPVLDFRVSDKPATIGTDMDPLDRKLSELSERITRLERRNTREDRDVTEGRRLVISVLKLLLRRLESE